MKKRGLMSRLIRSYTFLVLLSVFLISVISNLVLEQQFRKYIIQNQEKRNKEIIELVGQQYKGFGSWDRLGIENLGINALENGMVVKIIDSSGKVVWDAREYNNGMCESMITHMANNMYSRYRNWSGSYVKNEYSIKDNNANNIGEIEIGYYGPFYYTDNDLAFINTLNIVFVGVGLFSFVFAILIGIIMAKRLSKPISKVIGTAHMISKGDYGVRSDSKSNIVEIDSLTSTVNSLADNLEKQEKLRKQLTTDMAHELRTPLATLQSHMEAMLDGVWEADTERLRSCHEEIIRLNKMVGDLERLARYEGGNLILEKIDFDLLELVKRIITNFEGEFKNKNIGLELQGKELWINGDRDKISQIIINLISNALKYTNPGGQVLVAIKKTTKNTEIIVNDNGIGIPQEDLPYVFERFYRGDKSRNRETGGAGIGLTIAESIARAHGGSISVTSVLGEGTTFKLTLP